MIVQRVFRLIFEVIIVFGRLFSAEAISLKTCLLQAGITSSRFDVIRKDIQNTISNIAAPPSQNQQTMDADSKLYSCTLGDTELPQTKDVQGSL
jgi:hypothetical protein